MKESPPIDLDPAVLVDNIDDALKTLGASLSQREWKDAAPNGRVIDHRAIDANAAESASGLHARFVHQGIVEVAKKVFVKEVEVGVAEFDDQIYVVTDTPEETAAFLATPRVQEALVRLVGESGSVAVEGGRIRVEQEDPGSSVDEARAEVVALLAHL